ADAASAGRGALAVLPSRRRAPLGAAGRRTGGACLASGPPPPQADGPGTGRRSGDHRSEGGPGGAGRRAGALIQDAAVAGPDQAPQARRPCLPPVPVLGGGVKEGGRVTPSAKRRWPMTGTLRASTAWNSVACRSAGPTEDSPVPPRGLARWWLGDTDHVAGGGTPFPCGLPGTSDAGTPCHPGPRTSS